MVDEDEAVDVSEAAATDEAADDGAPEAEAPAEVEASADAEPAADAGESEEQEIDPTVQEFIGQESSTVLHHKAGTDEHGLPTEWRTPPGIPGGLDPKSLDDRDLPPRPT